MKRSPRPLLCSALVALVAAGALSLPVQAAGDTRWPRWVPQRTDSVLGREVLRILSPVTLRGRAHEAVVDELVALGQDSAPVLFAWLSGTLEGPEPVFEETLEVPENAVLPEVPREDLIVLDVLRRLPRGRVLPAVTSGMLQGSVDVKLVGMRVYAEVGDATAVEGWLDVLASVPELHLQRAYVQAPTEGALARILERDPQALSALKLNLARAEARVLPALVRAVGASGRGQGVEVLLALLGRDPALDLVLIAQTARLGEETLGTLAEEHLNQLRPYLTDKEWRVRREAAAALGRLQDHESSSALIDLLGDEQRLVGQTAGWALRRMSEQTLGEDAGAWREWFDGERRWFEGEGARLIEALDAPEPGVVVDALRELTAHRLYRHDVAQFAAPLLKHEQAAIAGTAAATLGGLGSRSAVAHLVGALEHAEDSVRQSAWLSLQQLTGKQWPADSSAWAFYVQ